MILTTIMNRQAYDKNAIPVAPNDAFDDSDIVYVPFAGKWWELSVVEVAEDDSDGS